MQKTRRSPQIGNRQNNTNRMCGLGRGGAPETHSLCLAQHLKFGPRGNVVKSDPPSLLCFSFNTLISEADSSWNAHGRAVSCGRKKKEKQAVTQPVLL